MSSQSCPMSFQQIDATIARIGAFFVCCLVLSFFATNSIVLLYILAVDFYIRIYSNKSYSLIYQLSKFIKKIFKLETKLTDSAAKRLAAQFGLLFSLVLIVLAHLELTMALYPIAITLLACASLEFIFEYCIGCKVYYVIKKIYPNFST